MSAFSVAAPCADLLLVLHPRIIKTVHLLPVLDVVGEVDVVMNARREVNSTHGN